MSGEFRDVPAVQLDDDLAVAVVVYFFELADVACVVERWCQRFHVIYAEAPPSTFAQEI